VDNNKELLGKAEVLRFPKGRYQSSSRDPRLQAVVDSYFTGGDYKVALSNFVTLIDQGNDEAYLFAAYIYEEGGNGVEQNFEKALFYYKKAAEEFGAVEGYLGAARCYYFGKGAPRDYGQAFRYYSAVERETDNAIAFHMLGKMYQYGQGIPKDLSIARSYFRKASEKGYVMGLVSVGQLEQEEGNLFRGWLLRIRGGILAFKIALKDRQDSRLRGW
jgi:TPR repeat protein